VLVVAAYGALACGRIDFGVVQPPADAVVATALQCDPCKVDGNCLVGTCVAGLCRVDLEIDIDWNADCHIGTDPTSTWTIKATNLRAGTYTITAIPSAGNFGVNLPWKYEAYCVGLDLSPLTTAPFNTPQEVEQALSTTPITRQFGGGDLRCTSFDSACADNLGDNRFRLADSCP